MRYIYYIGIILLGLSAVIGFELRRSSIAPTNAVIIINNKVITGEEFEKLYSASQPRTQSQTDFINSLITKELLIQESMRTGIDKEESFRRSIQNFYEQSLTKLLIDKKLSSLHITVADDEFNNYISSWNKIFHITIFRFDSPGQAAKSDYRNGKQMVIHQEDLCGDIGENIRQLKTGEITQPIKSGDQYLVLRLDKIDAGPPAVISEEEKERIKKMIEERQKEKIINDWISSLRKNATIKILLNEKK
jgi:hypothetical protein